MNFKERSCLRLKASPMNTPAKFPPELHPEKHLSRRCRHLAVTMQGTINLSARCRLRSEDVVYESPLLRREFGWYRGA